MTFIYQPAIEYIPPWRSINMDEVQFLTRQLRNELATGHPLFHMDCSAIARRDDNDDVLFSLKSEAPRLAVVHLTYQTNATSPNLYPYTVIYESIADCVTECMSEDVQYYAPIESPVGYIYGRDAVCLDEIQYDYSASAIHLKGEISGRLTSRPVEHAFPFTLSFHKIFACRIIGIDSWNYQSTSSFDQVINSYWCKQLQGKELKDHIHYVVQTYEDVIEVVCRKHQFTMRNSNP